MSNRTVRWILGGAAAAFLIAAIAAASLTVTWSSSASSARDATAANDARRHVLRVEHRRADAQIEAATEAATEVKTRFDAAATALEAVIDAHNRVADAHNGAVELFNAGRYAAASDKFVTDGEPAVAAEAAQGAAAHDALTNLKAAITKLEEALR